ncbi:uncharacterized protein ATC70_003804 [Mucor velutinosus]|uniref:Uncharacterized protein n=1 Tax=Mucor velutinosus TaxID=708070 RepID=A0AAN7HRF5_9FUNG|nr:hypothetical protein ATC70_003804 [Mucor velutinosus]
MTLTIEDVVTHYVLSSHPRNRAIIDVKDKKSGELRFIKIRHRLSKFYAVSLVDPVTFEVWAEIQVKSAAARIKPIILHLDNKQDTTVELKDTSRIGFEWTFAWEGEKYRWVRESRMSNSLECRAIRKTGDICVAQYLPRMLKDEYFGIFSLLGYNMLRCNLTKSRELELILLMSLMTVLDKSNDASWKRDPISKGVQDDIRNGGGSSSHTSSSNSSFVSPPSASSTANSHGMDHYEDPIPKKSQQKKHKVELLNDQKLQLMLEKDVRRSQKQIQLDQKNHKPSLSAGNSPNQTPKTSPLPTPSTSTNIMSNILSPRLSRQKSAALLTGNTNASQLSDASSLSPTSPTTSISNHSGTNNGAGRLSRLFNTLSQMKQTSDMVIIAPDTNAPADDFNAFYPPAPPPLSEATTNESHTKQQQKQQIARDQKLKLQRQKQRQQQQQQLLLLQQQQQQQQQQQAQIDQDYYEQHHHLSLPTGQLSRFTSDFGNLAISKTSYDNPPSLRNIRWNPEPLTSIETTGSSATNTYMSSRVPQQQPHYPPPHRSNSNGRRPRMADQHRRLSATEYSLYYNHNPPPPQPQPQPPHYTNTNYNNRYSTSEYYTHQYHQQQQAVYDYYQ